METGFFKWVWRFNALVIAGVVTCAAVAIVWDMTRDLRREWLPTRTTDTLAIAPTEAGTAPVAAPQTVARRYFGRPGTQGSGSIFAVPLYVQQKYENRGISKSSSGNIVNYRIVDMQAATNRWLFPATGVERLVLEAQPMILNTSQGNQRRIGYLLSVVEADTNGDARLSRRDDITLYFTDPRWAPPTKLTEGVTSLLTAKPQSTTQIDVFFDTVDGTHAGRFGFPDATLLSEQVIRTQD